jgi:hypothetical protein
VVSAAVAESVVMYVLRSVNHWPLRLAMVATKRRSVLETKHEIVMACGLPVLPPMVTRRAPALNSMIPTLALPPMLLTWEKAAKKLLPAASMSFRKGEMDPDSSRTSTMLAEHCFEKVGLAAATQDGHAVQTVPTGSQVLSQHAAWAAATSVTRRKKRLRFICYRAGV